MPRHLVYGGSPEKLNSERNKLVSWVRLPPPDKYNLIVVMDEQFELQYWAGRLLGNDQAYEIAEEIIESQKAYHKLKMKDFKCSFYDRGKNLQKCKQHCGSELCEKG